MTELVLGASFEELRSHFSDSLLNQKLMEFVEPLPDIEAEISEIAGSLSNSGKVTFLLGPPGTGKSTFVQSLSWRPHLRIARLRQINATAFTNDSSLTALYAEIERIAEEAELIKDKGPTLLVVDYLENLVDFESAEIKGFFRRLNGLLRSRPLFIVWPVTRSEDVNEMRGYAGEVSGTLFYRSKEVLEFRGPSEEKFVDIAKRTISVLNDGRELSDFSLTAADLEEVYIELRKLPQVKRTLREYIELVKARWRTSTDYQAKIRAGIPKATEVWFVFSYRNAESVVAQFVRRSQRPEDCWTAINDKLFEYVHNNTQRSAVWNAKRLQLALYGALKTRIMFLPTNTLISCIAAYGKNAALKKCVKTAPAAWFDKASAKRTLSRTPLYNQAVGEASPVGKRKGGPAAVAIEDAEPIFESVVEWLTSGGSDSDINASVGEALSELTNNSFLAGKPHPWIPNVIPDLFSDHGGKQVCIEFHHTTKDEPGIVADYVLKKLNVYMGQLEQLQIDGLAGG